jgi:hypothetical protein
MKNLNRTTHERFKEKSWGNYNHNFLTVLSNGHMQFKSPLDRVFCWKQSDAERTVRPRLWPYAVVEYPVTFLRLYKNLLNLFNVGATEFVALMVYINVKDFYLPEGPPEATFFDMQLTASKPFVGSKIEIERSVGHDFDPDRVAFELLRLLYAEFKLPESAIPFFDGKSGKFEL